MRLISFFEKQVCKWNEENKCGQCFEFHAPLTSKALNVQQLINPCCTQVLLTRDVGSAFGTDRTYNNRLAVLDTEYRYKNFRLQICKSINESVNNHTEILNNKTKNSKSAYLEDLEECIDNMELDFCEFIGTQWQVTQWRAEQIINKDDNNYTGYVLSVTIRKRIK